MGNDMPRNMISELRRRINRDGETTITAAEYNQLQVEWIRRIGAEQLIKEAEQRQLSEIKAKIFKGIKGCGDNSCLIEKPTGMATNGGCRCRDNRGKMAIILSRLSAILNAGGE